MKQVRLHLLFFVVMLLFLFPACEKNETGHGADDTNSSTTAVKSSSATSTSSTVTPGATRPRGMVGKNRRIAFSFGSTGRKDGQFIYARGIDADPVRKRIYILDRTGRLQLFDDNGNYIATWYMPKFEYGYATGISVEPGSGNVYVADTHNNRVVVFSPKGEVLKMFGKYGKGPGEFIYPTDVAFNSDGRIYVSEYGGNDRVQIFDSEGGYLGQFGHFGHLEDDNESFSRPQSLYFDDEAKELWVADSCNHRIMIYSEDGEFRRSIGTYGTEVGKFCYDYGLYALEDGSILVAEFGNNRFQRIDRAGHSLEILGKYGEEPGEFHTPWSMTMIGSRLYLLDSGNNRVQVIDWK